MSLTLKPYPEYKDSGLPWLGEIPAHWEVKRLKRVARINPSKAEAREVLDQGDDVAFLPMEKVGSNGEIDAREVLPVASVWNGFTYFRRGDVLLAKITPCFENGKGAYLDSLPTPVGFGSTEFIVMRANNGVTPQYLYRVTTLVEFRALGADAMTGSAGQQRVPPEFVRDFASVVPPLIEQNAIVHFLDRADGHVNRLIRAKQRLIELLNEQKQAIIHRAVTRGLDPDAPMKPIGLDWLPEVPEHWEIVSVKRLFAKMNYGTSENLGSTGSVRVLTMGHIQNGEIKLPEVGSLDNVPSGLILETNDLLFNRTNSPELVGKVGIFRGSSKDRVSFASYLVRLRPTAENDSEYLNLLLNSRSFLQFARSQALISLHQANLNSSRYGYMRVAVPAKEEQKIIVAWVKEEASTIDAAIARARREIELIREYRTRLISDVVTGKLDVRRVKLPGPEGNVETSLDESRFAVAADRTDGPESPISR